MCWRCHYRCSRLDVFVAGVGDVVTGDGGFGIDEEFVRLRNGCQ